LRVALSAVHSRKQRERLSEVHCGTERFSIRYPGTDDFFPHSVERSYGFCGVTELKNKLLMVRGDPARLLLACAACKDYFWKGGEMSSTDPGKRLTHWAFGKSGRPSAWGRNCSRNAFSELGRELLHEQGPKGRVVGIKWISRFRSLGFLDQSDQHIHVV
jgi:hypothetical protein